MARGTGEPVRSAPPDPLHPGPGPQPRGSAGPLHAARPCLRLRLLRHHLLAPAHQHREPVPGPGGMTRTVLVIRHGIAEEPADAHAAGRGDAERELTKEGRYKLKDSMAGLATLVDDIDLIASSPL